MSPIPPAARVDDPIHHNAGIAGYFIGAFTVAVAAVGVFLLTATTAGTGLVVLVAVGGAVGGGILGEGVARLSMPDGIHTGKLTEGATNVFVNGKCLVLMADTVEPCWIPVLYPHGAQGVVEGSMTVIVNCRPASRVGDEILCGAYIAKGSPNVFIGGPKGRINGTESSAWTFFLERLGITAFAAQTAIYPASGLLTLSGIAALQADYSTYKKITGGNAYVGWGIETGIALAFGNIGSAFRRSTTLNWNAFRALDTKLAYARYLNKPNTAGWSYSRWIKSFNGSYLTRIPNKIQKFETAFSGLLNLGGGKFKVGYLDVTQFIPALIRIAIDSSRANSPVAGGCAHDWYSTTE
jgi:uncharacterized Zn-binding protein involved in type VI secretion